MEDNTSSTSTTTTSSTTTSTTTFVPKPIVTCPGVSERFPLIFYKAFEQLWSTDLDNCSSLIEECRKNFVHSKTNPWFACVEAELAFYRFYGEESQNNENELEKSLVRVEAIANEMYTTFNPNQGVVMGNFYETEFTTGSGVSSLSLFLESVVIYAYYYLAYAMVNFRKQETVKGSYYFRKSWKYFEKSVGIIKKHEEKNIPIDPKIAGLVNFGCGLFHFVMSLVPPSLQFIVSLVGFVADRKHALEELQSCIDSGCNRAIEATIILILLKNFFIDEEEEAEEMLLRLQSLYSNSIMICYLSGFICRRDGEMQRAISFFEKGSILARDKMKSTQLFTTTKYHMGYCYFVLNDWENAAKNYEVFLSQDVSLTGKRFRPYTAYQLGYCYWRLERKSEIASLYTNAMNWIRPEQSFDKFAQRKMNQFLEDKGFSTFDEVTIASASLIEGHEYKKALKLVETLIPLLKDPQHNLNRDYFASFYFLKGEALKGLKMYDRSKQMYERVTAEDGHLVRETYLIPYSWVGLGEIAMEQREWDTALQHFNHAKTFANYDWMQLLSFRIYGNQQKLDLRKSKYQS